MGLAECPPEHAGVASLDSLLGGVLVPNVSVAVPVYLAVAEKHNSALREQMLLERPAATGPDQLLAYGNAQVRFKNAFVHTMLS